MEGEQRLAQRDSARLTRREGREFAFPVGIAFLVLAGVLYVWRGHVTMAAAFSGLGVLLLAAGLLVPTRLEPLRRAWMGFAHALSKVTTPIFMSVVYYLVLTPSGLLRRAIGRNPIHHAASNDSYWAARADDQRRSNLQRQF